MPDIILYSGAIAQVPRHGGLAWFHLQFLLGLRRLGYEVLLLDRLEPGMAGNPDSFHRAMRDFGLEHSYSLTVGGEVYGVPRRTVIEKARAAIALINVMGYCNDVAVLESVDCRVFLDIDPGFPQMWRELGLHDAFAGHTRFATLARNIGRPECTIPTCGLDWITLPQPVVLEHWPRTPPPPDGAFTSVGAWRGPNGPVDFGGRVYGLRCHEFRKFLALPARCPGTRFEQAMAIDDADAKDIAALAAHGWQLVDPRSVAGSPQDYRRYIGHSKAEFVVPKQMYVATRSGLLSDRSVAYLATGRPVLACETGLEYPLGEGLLTFSTLDEAAAGVDAINADYDRHCSAARGLAETQFDSDKVLSKFLEDCVQG